MARSRSATATVTLTVDDAANENGPVPLVLVAIGRQLGEAVAPLIASGRWCPVAALARYEARQRERAAAAGRAANENARRAARAGDPPPGAVSDPVTTA